MHSDSITFVANHKPPLTDGVHTLEVTHTLKYGEGKAAATHTFAKKHTIYVRGERFALRPDHIHKVFPPANAVGDFDSVLPHVVLSRKTLPWERGVTSGDKDHSWLAVLVFAKEEAPKLVSSKVSDLQKSSLSTHMYSYGVLCDPLLQPGSGETLDDVCAYLDIPASLFNASAPTLDDLRWNAHARKRGPTTTVASIVNKTQFTLSQSATGTGTGLSLNIHLNGTSISSLSGVNTTSGSTTCTCANTAGLSVGQVLTGPNIRAPLDYAVVVGNRLCPAGTTAVAHLVSLEGLGPVLPKADGTPQLPTDIKTVRLVSLKSWEFRVLPLQESFDAILKGLNQGGSADTELLLPAGVMPDIPQVVNTARLDEGFTMLGESAATAATYRGPLMPWGMASPSEPATDWLPVDHAEQLSNNTNNDESYSAAWQLGRLLALADKGYAVTQVGWKRDLRLRLNATLRQSNAVQGGSRAAYAAQVRAILASADALKSHLIAPEVPELPGALTDWLAGLALLQGVPFHYLVPDARMLPPESIRFFNVDQKWLSALLDGAWSLGREKVSKWAFDTAFQPWRDAKVARPQSGLLIQSRLISGYWPGILISRDDGAKIVREERLGPTTLLLLFDLPFPTSQKGVNLTIQEPPEGIHFGFVADVAEDKDGVLKLSKTLRDISTGEETAQSVTDIPFRPPYSNVLDLSALATTTLQVTDASQFALQMVQKVSSVTFQLSA